MNFKSISVLPIILFILSVCAQFQDDLLGLSLSSKINNHILQFQAWKQKYHKKFLSSQEAYRKILFEKKKAEVEAYNSQNLGVIKEVNLFATMTQDQLKAVYLNPVILNASMSGLLQTQSVNSTMLKSMLEINWISMGGVSSVKDQGACGSCWAFSVIAAIQSRALIVNKTTVDLSEQQLVDCTSSYGNSGCNGGWPSYALNYILYNGVSLESEYPYVKIQQTCKKNGGSFRIRGIKYSRGCPEIQGALKIGPTTVAVEASNWFDYKTGIFSSCTTAVNHAVLLVGVTSTAWIVKNSWGASWGQNGFIRLALGNTCGICAYATSFPA